MTAHGSTAAHDEDEHEIHLPAPSLSPLVIAVGVTLACFGLLFTPILIVVGAATFVIGLVTWLLDDARTFGQAAEGDSGHGATH